MRIWHIATAAGLMMLGWSGTANASLIGDTVTQEILYPTKSVSLDSSSAVVKEFGAEFFQAAQEAIDFTASQITLTFVSPGHFNPAEFSGLKFTDLTKAFSAVSFVSSTVAGIDASDISFENGSIFVNEEGGIYQAGSTVVLNVSTVPLPASAPLFGAGLLGLAGLGIMARKRKGSVAVAA